jgi:hypothetical protein
MQINFVVEAPDFVEKTQNIELGLAKIFHFIFAFKFTMPNAERK